MDRRDQPYLIIAVRGCLLQDCISGAFLMHDRSIRDLMHIELVLIGTHKVGGTMLRAWIFALFKSYYNTLE